MFYDFVDQSVIFRPATPTVLGKALQMQNLALYTTAMESKSAFTHGDR